MTTVELIISVDVDKAGNEPTEQAVRETVCKALDKVKLSRRGWKMSFATVSPYKRESKPDYFTDAGRDAAETVKHFLDCIVEQLMDKGAAGDHLYNDYPNGDQYHYENHTDKDYDLSESADVLSQLSENVETDHGLWEKMEPKDAIAAQAAYTYGNAVIDRFGQLIEKINERYDILTVTLDDWETDAAEQRKRLEELESLSKRDRNEYNELRALRAKAIGEEAVAKMKQDAIREMVQSIIREQLR